MFNHLKTEHGLKQVIFDPLVTYNNHIHEESYVILATGFLRKVAEHLGIDGFTWEGIAARANHACVGLGYKPFEIEPTSLELYT